jgi:hypothetical protein
LGKRDRASAERPELAEEDHEFQEEKSLGSGTWDLRKRGESYPWR